MAESQQTGASIRMITGITLDRGEQGIEQRLHRKSVAARMIVAFATPCHAIRQAAPS
jgi:hypothetical protein